MQGAELLDPHQIDTQARLTRRVFSCACRAAHHRRPDMHTFDLFHSDEEIAAIGRGLLDRTLPKSSWTHAAHFAAALWLLEHGPDGDAENTLPGLIRAYNEATGRGNS